MVGANEIEGAAWQKGGQRHLKVVICILGPCIGGAGGKRDISNIWRLYPKLSIHNELGSLQVNNSYKPGGEKSAACTVFFTEEGKGAISATWGLSSAFMTSLQTGESLCVGKEV